MQVVTQVQALSSAPIAVCRPRAVVSAAQRAASAERGSAIGQRLASRCEESSFLLSEAAL